MPEVLLDEPTVLDANLEYWRAFAELSKSRQNGMDPNPIAITAVQTWCEFNGVAQWRRRLMWGVIRSVDDALSELQAERREAEKAKP